MSIRLERKMSAGRARKAPIIVVKAGRGRLVSKN
jgi:hypothetical protein